LTATAQQVEQQVGQVGMKHQQMLSTSRCAGSPVVKETALGTWMVAGGLNQP